MSKNKRKNNTNEKINVSSMYGMLEKTTSQLENVSRETLTEEQKQKNKTHYNGKLLLSKNRMLNLILSPRGGGKSFWFKKFVVEEYLKKGYEFIYLRRYNTDIERALENKSSSFFGDLQKEGYFTECEVDENKTGFFINGKQCGYNIALSSATSNKSISYKNVHYIIYEEFLTDKKEVRPLSNEPRRLVDFINTVDRYEDRVTVFCLANCISLANDYFEYFKIYPKKNTEFTLGEQVLIQMWNNKEFTEYAKNSRLGKLITNTSYGDYAIGGEFLKDNEHFIETKTPRSSYSFGFRINNKNYAVWIDYNVGKYFVNQQHDSNRITFVFTLDDMTPNTLFLSARKPEMLRHFQENFRLGNVYCENQTCKQAVFDMMNISK